MTQQDGITRTQPFLPARHPSDGKLFAPQFPCGLTSSGVHHDLTSPLLLILFPSQESFVCLCWGLFADNPTPLSGTLSLKTYIHLWGGSLATSNNFEESQSGSNVKLLNVVFFNVQCNVVLEQEAVDQHEGPWQKEHFLKEKGPIRT